MGLSAGASPASAADAQVFHLWSELTAEQRAALAPLAADWNNFPVKQQARLLKVAKGFDKLSPAQRQRVHARLRDWAYMTPEQRSLARQNYKKLIELPARKQAQIKRHWTQVQSSNDAETPADEAP